MYAPPPQPAKLILVQRRIQQKDVAARLGCSRHWVCQVLNAHVPPPERFKAELSTLLGLPVDELFRDNHRAGDAA